MQTEVLKRFTNPLWTISYFENQSKHTHTITKRCRNQGNNSIAITIQRPIDYNYPTIDRVLLKLSLYFDYSS